MAISADSPNPPPAASSGAGKPPVLIIGAGVSGLLLAQHLKREGIAFRVFERDGDLATRGAGWGLTLHWSLAALQSLLPAGLAERICDESSVDRWADRRGEASRFPFFNLESGELKTQTPGAVKSARIRVTRERLRRLLAEGIDIEWGKSLHEFTTNDNGTVNAIFDDGASCTGTLLVACDGGQSRVRRVLFPDETKLMMQLPVRTMGVKISLTAEQIEPIRKLDLFFLQGGSPLNNSFMYISVLDVPGNQIDSNPDVFHCQMHLSWPYHSSSGALIDVPATNQGRYELMVSFAKTWAEPFHSFVLNNVRPDTPIKRLDVLDWGPPFVLLTTDRGEGANHAIIDVRDFATHVVPILSLQHTQQGVAQAQDSAQALRQALDSYEDAVVSRSRPGVLASRRACLDAHAYSRLFGEGASAGGISPLLSKREMALQFDDESMELMGQ
ncbi:FAD/NAD(P)-binding domain-containing protein [Trichoderma asperelloides]|nr:FAD/NAD(P)-binding domain-containing protein [Trichoderma asperelloides]